MKTNLKNFTLLTALFLFTTMTTFAQASQSKIILDYDPQTATLQQNGTTVATFNKKPTDIIGILDQTKDYLTYLLSQGHDDFSNVTLNLKLGRAFVQGSTVSDTSKNYLNLRVNLNGYTNPLITLKGSVSIENLVIDASNIAGPFHILTTSEKVDATINNIRIIGNRETFGILSNSLENNLIIRNSTIENNYAGVEIIGNALIEDSFLSNNTVGIRTGKEESVVEIQNNTFSANKTNVFRGDLMLVRQKNNIDKNGNALQF